MNKQQIAKMAKSHQYSESPTISATKKKQVFKTCAEARVKQFPDNFYAEENVLFCKFFLNSVDTIKAHIKLKTQRSLPKSHLN